MAVRYVEDPSRVTFPMWVKGATPCKMRTQSVVLAGGGFKGGRHGAVRIVKAFANRPVRKLPRVGLPGYYIAWADMQSVVCPETGYAECAERHCGIHYMEAPVKLA